jgi:magnesium-transporting ATPase (P-type)
LRTCLVAQYSYYKSFLFCVIQILFGFSNGFSGTTLFNSACVTAYNAVLFFPILTFVIDQDLPGDSVFSVPEVYRSCQQSRHFNTRTYSLWMIRATFQALVIYFMTVGIYSTSFISSGSPGGFPADYESLGLLAFSSYLAVQSVTLVLEIRYLTIYNFAAIIGFHALTFLCLFISNGIIAFDDLIGYQSFTFVLGQPTFWLGTLVTTALATLPVVAIQYIAFSSFPSALQVLRARLIRTGKLEPPDTSLNGSETGICCAKANFGRPSLTA